MLLFLCYLKRPSIVSSGLQCRRTAEKRLKHFCKKKNIFEKKYVYFFKKYLILHDTFVLNMQNNLMDFVRPFSFN